jgi:hypothetical protein
MQVTFFFKIGSIVIQIYKNFAKSKYESKYSSFEFTYTLQSKKLFFIGGMLACRIRI